MKCFVTWGTGQTLLLTTRRTVKRQVRWRIDLDKVENIPYRPSQVHIHDKRGELTIKFIFRDNLSSTEVTSTKRL